jgi:hypothetical protein
MLADPTLACTTQGGPITTTVAGTGLSGSTDGPALLATFVRPAALAVSSDNAVVFIADRDNFKVRALLRNSRALFETLLNLLCTRRELGQRGGVHRGPRQLQSACPIEEFKGPF